MKDLTTPKEVRVYLYTEVTDEAVSGLCRCDICHEEVAPGAMLYHEEKCANHYCVDCLRSRVLNFEESVTLVITPAKPDDIDAARASIVFAVEDAHSGVTYNAEAGRLPKIGDRVKVIRLVDGTATQSWRGRIGTVTRIIQTHSCGQHDQYPDPMIEVRWNNRTEQFWSEELAPVDMGR